MSVLLSALNQKNTEIDAIKTSLKVLGYNDLLHLVKTLHTSLIRLQEKETPHQVVNAITSLAVDKVGGSPK